MSQDTFLLQKGVDSEGNIVEVRAKPFYREGRFGVADSVQAVEDSGLVRVPSYMIVAGRASADKTEPVWAKFSDSYGERLTVKDKRGILGTKGQVYVIGIQNGGVFMGNHEKIRRAVKKNLLKNYAMPLEPRSEVNPLLDAIKDSNPLKALKELGWTKSDSVYVFNNFGDFDDASQADNFLVENPAYIVVRRADEAKTEPFGYKAMAEQKNNQSLIIASGGRKPLIRMLDQATSFGWNQFGSWHDGYKNINSGRVVVLYNDNRGIYSDNYINDLGRSLGVAPEELAKRAKIVGPAPLEKLVEKETPSDDVRMIPESLVRRLLTDHLGYNEARTEEHLRILSLYQGKQ